MSPIIGGVSGGIEEYMFRYFIIPNIILSIEFNLYSFVCLIIVSIIFIILQVIYVETKSQKLILMIGATSISLVSIILIFITKNIISSILMHFLYVVLFNNRRKE